MTSFVLDHVVLAVADLNAATTAYTSLLGRTPSWRGRHPVYGTRNTLYKLDNTYFELLAADGKGALADIVRAALGEREERPFALALGVSDMDSAVREARKRGIELPDAAEGSGTDDDSGRRRSWRNTFIEPRSVHGIRLLLIEHTSPPELLPPAAEIAAPSCSGIDHVVVFTQDIDASRATWTEKLRVREDWRRDFPERGTRNLGLDLGGIIVELIVRTDRVASDKPDTLWGVAFRVADCQGAADRLRNVGIEIDAPRSGLADGTRVAAVRWKRTPTLLIEKR